jgi:hypothetical protein
MKKLLIIIISIILLGVFIFPIQVNAWPTGWKNPIPNENVTSFGLPRPPTTMTPNGWIPQPPADWNAAKYYLGNWGKTPIKDRGELAR